MEISANGGRVVFDFVNTPVREIFDEKIIFFFFILAKRSCMEAPTVVFIIGPLRPVS